MSYTEIQQPVIPDAREFIAEVGSRGGEDSEDFPSREYGHTANALAFNIEVNTFYDDPEEAARMQRAAIVATVKKAIEIYGPGIASFFRDELKLVFDEEELKIRPPLSF